MLTLLGDKDLVFAGSFGSSAEQQWQVEVLTNDNVTLANPATGKFVGPESRGAGKNPVTSRERR
ncbi:hypothetical protein [Streptomyces fulvorobeus]|uniref:Uncharacterized protein n=1 Tax=Streptomyces fulvorobeus TaxID=284028 RepID=A0A7J0C193_9ACTN|nr:hypothetical protein [Streptomyces fulvorobeus]NYE39508.1 hypothetical protein [Streptomyces fulvorobeus]GFM95744.1 hypothetical protein Sfulv_05550 [Streptomyces fulvorobeus]